MKKTSPQVEVKTVSKTRRQTIAQNPHCSPTLKRLQSRKLTTNAARTNLSSRNSENSPINLKKLLLTWEDLSTRNLTPAVEKRTKLGNFVDGQSRLSLEKCTENLENVDCTLIGGGFGKLPGFGNTSQ
jgi:hypothetical protein